jgi:cytochrome P450 family 135
MPRPVQTLGWLARPMPFMERCHERYGDMFTLRITQEGNWVYLAHPDLVKQVFKGDPRLMHAGEANRVLGPLVGHHSVLLLDDAQHMAQRKLLLPPFHGERMQRYGELMADATEREMATWPTGTPLPLWPRMQAITLEVIVRAVFGVQDPRRVETLRAAIETMTHAVTSALALAVVALLGPNRVEKLRLLKRDLAPVDRLLFEEIETRRSAPDLEDREDILSMLLLARHEDGSPMSDQELRDELVTLLVAGHETTATSLAWALERLVRHPDKLERLRDEVRSGGDEYMDAVSRETLRLRPVLPVVVRRLQEPMQFGDHLLPTGTAVTPCIHLIHRRPEIYPDPRAFRPERFLEQPAGTYSWIPFGGGVRRCIGASFALFEMKQVLGTVIDRLDLRASRPGGESISRRSITLTPNRGAEIVVEPQRSRKAARAPAAA